MKKEIVICQKKFGKCKKAKQNKKNVMIPVPTNILPAILFGAFNLYLHTQPYLEVTY